MYTVGRFFELLHELSNRLAARGEHATILLFGGGALSMRYGARQMTRDLDVSFQAVNRTIVKELALEVSRDFGVDPDWINDEGTGNVTKEILEEATSYLELPGLTVLSPTKEALLAMKVCSMRMEKEYPDLADIKFLLSDLGITDAQVVLGITVRYRPDYERLLTPKHQYVVELLIDEVLREKSQTT